MAEMNIQELKRQITPCDMENPFVFVSYSKRDCERVYPLVLSLQKEGCNLWIDKELEKAVGEDWQKALKIMESRKCRAIVFMMSANSLISAPVLAELIWSQKSPKVLRHNNNEPLKFLPVNVDKAWRIKNCGPLQDWIKGEVNQVDDDITAADMDALAPVKGGDCLPDKYYSGANSLSEVGEIADVCYDEILVPLGGNRLTLVEYTDISVIVDNILNKTGTQKLKHEVQPAASDTKDNDGEAKISPAPAAQEEKKPGETKAKRRASVTGDITYTIYGREYTDNQASMMLNVFAKVLKNHPDKVPEVIEKVRCTSAVNYELPENKTADMPSRYLQGQYFDVGGGIFVGTSLNLPEKSRNIANLLNICGEDRSILQSEQIELPETVKTKAASSGDEVYSIDGREYSGNQTKMMVDVIRYLMEKHFDKREKMASLLCVKLAPLDELQSQNITYFRTGGEFTYQGVTYSIGTSFGKKDKLRQISKAIAICGEDFGSFEIDGLDSEPKAVRGRSSVKRNFLDD